MENVMNYKNFINEFKKKVIENSEWNISEKEFHFYPKGYKGTNEVEQKFIRETNMKYYLIEWDVLLGDFVVLQKWKNEGLISENRYCLKKMYQEYIKTGWENILNAVDKNVAVMSNQKVDDTMEQMKVYEKTKNQLIIHPLNYTDNKDTLKNAIYKLIGDVALVVYIKLEDSGENLLSCKLDKNLFATWGTTEDEIFETAMINTNAMAMPRLYFKPQDTINAPYYRGEFMSEGSKINKINKYQIPILATTKKLNGAVALFYPGVMEKISTLLGGSYYVAFTSMHEVRVHAIGSISPRKVLNSLKDVNKMFDKNEILSRKVFVYDAKSAQLTALEL